MHLYHIWSIMKKIHHIVLSSGITGVILKAQTHELLRAYMTQFTSVLILYMLLYMYVCTCWTLLEEFGALTLK